MVDAAADTGPAADPSPRTSTGLPRRLRRALQRIRDQEGPFRAGLLDRERIIATLAARAPDIDWEARVPAMPVDPSVFLSADPPVGPAGRRAPTWTKPEMTEFRNLVASGALRRAPTDRPLTFANLFFVRQGEKLRLIFDARPLNAASTEPETFALDDILSLPAYYADKNVRMLGKIDIKSAYWQVPVAADQQHLFACRGPDGRDYVWTALPMGWAQAPRIFQQLSECFRDAWRACGWTVSTYLDDFLFGARTLAEYEEMMETAIDDLLAAGWQLAEAKCELEPREERSFLGILVNVTRRALRLPEDKIVQLTATADDLRRRERVSLEDLETFVGRASFARMVCHRVGFFLVHLYRLLPRQMLPPEWNDEPSRHPDAHHRLRLRWTGLDRAATVAMTEPAREELAWWVTASDRLRRERPWDRLACAKVWASRMTRDSLARAIGTVRADTSDTGFGGTWTPAGADERRRVPFIADLLPTDWQPQSSCAREIYGAARVIEALPRRAAPPGSLVRVVLDAQAAVGTAVSGSACAGTVRAARRLDEALEQKQLEAAFEWAPREELEAEDAGSRAAAADAAQACVTAADLRVYCHWAFGVPTPTVDAFASPATAQAERFGSRWPGDGSSGDGFDVLAARDAARPERVWVYPPFALSRPAVTRVLMAAAACPRNRYCLLVPQRPQLLSMLRAAGWRIRAGPRHLRMPDGQMRAPIERLMAATQPRRAADA